MLPVLTLFLAGVASTAPKSGPCDLVDRATVVALLGPKSSPGTLSGPAQDDETTGMVSYCTYMAGTTGLIVSEVTFKSAAEALKETTKEVVSSKMDGGEATIVVEPGLGDKAYWAITSEGAEYVVVKGSIVFAIGLGGQLPNPPVSYRKALRAATTAALLKL